MAGAMAGAMIGGIGGGVASWVVAAALALVCAGCGRGETPGAGSATGAGSGTEAVTGSGSGPEAETGSGSEAGTDSGTVAGTGSGSGSGSGSETVAGPETDDGKRIVATTRVALVEEVPTEDYSGPFKTPIGKGWEEHACFDFAARLAKGTPGGVAHEELAREAAKLVEPGDDGQARHLMAEDLERITLSYAACRVVADGAWERCGEHWTSAADGECEVWVLNHELARAAAKREDCTERLAGFDAVREAPGVWATLCGAAASGEPAACAELDQNTKWVCEMFATRDVATCEGLARANDLKDCQLRVALTRAMAGLEAQSEVVGEDEPIKIMWRLLTMDGFTCDGWMEEALRRACR